MPAPTPARRARERDRIELFMISCQVKGVERLKREWGGGRRRQEKEKAFYSDLEEGPASQTSTL